mmetsp:Transcript_37717/g.70338  ORF Transcript_37717/g.70338 Transcript_37717/m.70338 type:complete len:186 (+) Transcript_37717:64-621(+)
MALQVAMPSPLFLHTLCPEPEPGQRRWPVHVVVSRKGDRFCSITVAALTACGSRVFRVCRGAAPALKRITKDDTKTKKISSSLWGVVIGAKIWKGRWWQFWKPVMIRFGLQTCSVGQFGEMLSDALPELTPDKAQRVAGELVEDAMVNEMGKALVLGDDRDKAERCRQRLQAKFPGLEVLVEPMA